MQFSKIIIALFAGVALAAPSNIEQRQDTRVRDDPHTSTTRGAPD